MTEKLRSGLAAKPVTDTINELIDRIDALEKLVVGDAVWVDQGPGEEVAVAEKPAAKKPAAKKAAAKADEDEKASE